MEANFDRFVNMVVDMDSGASNQGFYHISELCRVCVGIVDEIRGSRGFELKMNLELLKQLGHAIRTPLNTENYTDNIARDIARTASGAR